MNVTEAVKNEAARALRAQGIEATDENIATYARLYAAKPARTTTAPTCTGTVEGTRTHGGRIVSDRRPCKAPTRHESGRCPSHR
jgi:hypothetical protein